MTVRRLLFGAVLALTLAAPASVARAQLIPPLPPLPPLPPEATAPLAPLGPVVDQPCITIGEAIALLPVVGAALPGGLPNIASTIVGPVVYICGTIPRPQPAPTTSPAAPGQPAFGTGGGTAPGTDAVDTNEPAPDLASGDAVDSLGSVTDLTDTARRSSAEPILEENQRAASALVTTPGSPGFAYPIILALPLILLALGGYLAWALTRPVVAHARAAASYR